MLQPRRVQSAHAPLDANPEQNLANVNSASNFKLADRPFSRIPFFALLLFLGILFILAYPLRFSARFFDLFNNQVRPLVLRPAQGTLAKGYSSTTSPAMAQATFTKPPQAPPLFTGTSDSIVADTKKLIEGTRAMQDALAKDIDTSSADFKNVLFKLAQDENSSSLSSRVLGFYQAVSAKKELRDASTEADKMLDEFHIEASMREDMYELVEAVYRKKEKLEPEEQRFLEKARKGYIQNGLNLPAGPQRDRFRDIKLKLSQLAIEFQRTLNEESGGIWFTPEELDGVPEEVKEDLEKGEGENAGKLRLTFKYPHLFPTLKYATNPDTRKKLTIENENKCQGNVALFKEATVLRDEAARLLGYKTHAQFRIEDKMAKSPESVDEFLGDLRTRLTPVAEKELEVLKQLKKSDLESKGQKWDGNYYIWDHRYYSRMQLERDYQVDQQRIAEYFPLRTTLARMLKIFEQLLGLKFVEVKGEDRVAVSPTGKGEDVVWHEDVQLFSVWNDESEGNGFVGYLYTDLFPRLGKYVLY